jgi:hypothetical protein
MSLSADPLTNLANLEQGQVHLELPFSIELTPLHAVVREWKSSAGAHPRHTPPSAPLALERKRVSPLLDGSGYVRNWVRNARE